MVGGLLLALQTVLSPPASVDPFAFFRPSVAMTDDDRRQLDRGASIARILPGQDREVAVFAAVAVDIDGDRLVQWMRRIEELKKSSYVLAIGRFSDPPRIEDLAGLALDDEELSAARQCRPGDCALKLSEAEMRELRRAADEARAGWKPALQQAFRQMILRRVRTYLAQGQSALGPYEDGERPVFPGARLTALVGHATFLDHLPSFATYLDEYPRLHMPSVESFLYWSKERLARRATIGVTHVSIVRSTAPGAPDVLVAGKQIFTTRYVNASLGVTALIRGEPGHHAYLAYLNRSDVDVLGGTFGGIVRWFVQRRVKAEAADVLVGLKHRLESGQPDPRPSREGSGSRP